MNQPAKGGEGKVQIRLAKRRVNRRSGPLGGKMQSPENRKSADFSKREIVNRTSSKGETEPASASTNLEKKKKAC